MTAACVHHVHSTHGSSTITAGVLQYPLKVNTKLAPPARVLVNTANLPPKVSY